MKILHEILMSYSAARAQAIIARHCLPIIILIFLVIDCSFGQSQLKSKRNATITTSQQAHQRQEQQTGAYLQQEPTEHENSLLSWQQISGDNEIRRLYHSTTPEAITTTARPKLVRSRHVRLPQIEPTTSTTTPKPSTQSSLITRTTDAIYRALSGYFSHDDDEQDEQDDKELASTLSPIGSDPRDKTKPLVPTSAPLNQSISTTTTNTSDTHAATATKTTPSPAIKTKTKPTQATKSTQTPQQHIINQPSRTNKDPLSIATTRLPTVGPTTLRPIASTTTKKSPGRTSSRPNQTTPIPKTLTTERPDTIAASTTTTTAKSIIDESPKSTIQPHLDLDLYQDEPESLVSSSTKSPAAAPAPATTTSPTSKSVTPPKQTSSKTKSTTTTTTTTTSTERPNSNFNLRTTTLGPSGGKDAWPDIASNWTATNATSGKVVVVDKAANAKEKELHENSIEIFSFLKKAIDSIYSFKELTYLNRTTRLVHENGELPPADNGVSNLLPSGNESGGGGEREETYEDEAHSSNVDEGGNQAGGGVQKQKLQQVTTRDEIMLLCKLLHKQLENGSIITTANGTLVVANNSTGLLASSAPPTHHSDKQQKSIAPTTATTTVAPLKARNLLEEFVASGMHIRDPQNDLNETHENRLLESTFALERRAANEASYEESAQSLLADLYNAAFKQKFYNDLTMISRPGSQTNTDNSSSSSSPNSSERESHKLNMKLWSKTITGGRGGSLRLVYWLILQAANNNIGAQSSSLAGYNSSPAKGPPLRFRVLNADEASDLMDVLDHSIIQQAIDNSPLIRPIVLVAPYRRSIRAQNGADQPQVGGDDANSPPSPHVIDDTLTGTPGGNQQSQSLGNDKTGGSNQTSNNRPSSMQLFVDKIFKSSFNDNLYLYLILFIIAFFLIVLCFAIPAICTKLLYSRSGTGNMTSSTATNTPAGRLSSAGSGNNNSSHYSGPHHVKRTRHGSHVGGESQSRRAAHAARYPTSAGADKKAGAISSISGAFDHSRRDDRSYLDDDYDQDYARSRGISGTINEAVWTKLSNSTTTLTKDQTRTMYDDGQVCVPILRHGQEALDREQLDREKLKRYEWYTFEDKTTTTTTARRNNNLASGNGTGARGKRAQTFALDDHYKATKSVQTSEGRDDGEDQAVATDATLRAGDQRLMNMNMSFRDRIETRNSDTLTKSELVMIKEKLIPIGRQKGAALVDSRDSPGLAEQVGQHLQRPSHDYVNTTVASSEQNDHKLTKLTDLPVDDSEGIQTRATSGLSQMATGGSLDFEAAKHGPVGSDRAGRSPAGSEQIPANIDQRTPKMRYLELPKKAQVKVDEIKGELSRLERRDSGNQKQSMSGTYKRYDVL